MRMFVEAILLRAGIPSNLSVSGIVSTTTTTTAAQIKTNKLNPSPTAYNVVAPHIRSMDLAIVSFLHLSHSRHIAQQLSNAATPDTLMEKT
mmetsp:Transcript_25197/g.29041  ORF Transcript_25197/g.29041 Transcript_25197/m.29041 type:complete len:91 (-) Transcript_25197:145-417(-)